MEIFYVFIAATFSNNYVLSQLLGIYPTVDKRNKGTAMIWEGLFITITTLILALLGHGLYIWVLEPLGLSYMTMIVMTLLLSIIAHFVVLIFSKTGKYNSIEITAGQIISNSIILAVVLFSIDQDSSLPAIVGRAVGAGAGYTLVSILLSDVMDKIDESSIVPAFRGIPIKLISLGLMAYAFWGFCCLAP